MMPAMLRMRRGLPGAVRADQAQHLARAAPGRRARGRPGNRRRASRALRPRSRRFRGRRGLPPGRPRVKLSTGVERLWLQHTPLRWVRNPCKRPWRPNRMRTYWLRILLGALAVFAVGMIGLTFARRTRDTVTAVVTGSGPLSIPLPFVPFELEGNKLGRLERLVVNREAPKKVSSVDLEVKLDDSLRRPGTGRLPARRQPRERLEQVRRHQFPRAPARGPGVLLLRQERLGSGRVRHRPASPRGT